MELLHTRKHYLKAAWFPRAPAPSTLWANLSQAAPEHMLTTQSWDPALPYTGSVFGSAANYSTLFQQAFQHEPSPYAASASATFQSLSVALQEAFEACSLPLPGAGAHDILRNSSAIKCSEHAPKTGYERVLDSLSRQSLDTFYGRVGVLPCCCIARAPCMGG